MQYDCLESYIEKVYGYAVKRTYSREEADELAQEGLLTRPSADSICDVMIQK